MTTWHW